MKRFIPVFLFSVIVLTSSCLSYYEQVRRSTDAKLKYDAAKKFFKERKFKKASDLFEELILLSQGTPEEDTINFYTGLSKYRYGNTLDAEGSFTKFISEFPRSPFVEEAKYLRIKCLVEDSFRYELDQNPSRKAMMAIGEFLYDNPRTRFFEDCTNMLNELQERIDRKNFESAKLYYDMEDYLAAHVALKNVLKENADNIYRENILYYTALAAYKYAYHSIPSKQKERYMNFTDDYYNFIGEFPESKYKKELTGYFDKIQKLIKKN